MTQNNEKNTCPNCKNEVFYNCKFCGYCGARIELQCDADIVDDKNESAENEQNEGFDYSSVSSSSVNNDLNNRDDKGKKNPLKNKWAIVITVFLALAVTIVGVFAAYTIVDNIKQKNEATTLDNQYKELEKMMLSASSANYKKIEETLGLFPTDYRDVDDIKIEYNQLKKNIDIIENMPWYPGTSKESDALRKAYISLIEFNQNNHRWDLSEYLNDTVYNEQFANLIFGKEWSNSYYYFQWYDDGDGKQKLRTDLPNDKNNEKEYYFYTDSDRCEGLSYSPSEFGYENQNDKTDKFLAYKIVDIAYSDDKWQIRIYCYSNKQTYILE